MNTERPSAERSSAKDFQWRVEKVDREKHHVYIIDGNETYKWFVDADRRIILVSGDERRLTKEKRDAMTAQVAAILAPQTL
jgi:hypothetical protein